MPFSVHISSIDIAAAAADATVKQNVIDVSINTYIRLDSIRYDAKNPKRQTKFNSIAILT